MNIEILKSVESFEIKEKKTKNDYLQRLALKRRNL